MTPETPGGPIVIGAAFDLGESVYLRTDPDQRMRLVTAISIRPGRATYELSFATTTSWHDVAEISRDRDPTKI